MEYLTTSSLHQMLASLYTNNSYADPITRKIIRSDYTD